MRVVRYTLIALSIGILLLFSAYFIVSSRQETVALTPKDRASAPGDFIQLTKGLTHYLKAGQDSSDLVVLIHGGGITGIEVWKGNIPFLVEKGYSVLAYDLYGRGYSDRARVDYTPELFQEQLSDLLDTLRIDKPFHIVTMSMGAMVALDYTAAHPDNVKKMVLIDPATTGDFKPSILLRIPLVNTALMTMYWYPNAVENQRKEFVDQELFNRYSDRLKYFMNFSGYKYVNYSTWMNMLGQSKIHLLDSVEEGRVLMLYGQHDPYFPPGNVEVYSQHYPSLRHKVIEGAGHMPHVEKPDDVNQLIYSFFRD